MGTFEFGSSGEAGWRRLGSRLLAESPWLRVEEVEFATPSRPEGGLRWTVARRKAAVVVAPRLADGRFLLVHQERAAVERTLWEFPAGQIDDAVADHAVAATARRELAEECAHRLVSGGRLLPLGCFFSSPGFTDERAFLFLADPVEPVPAPEGVGDGSLGEGDEAIREVRAVSAEGLSRWIAEGRIEDANTLAAFARLVALGILQAPPRGG